MKLQPRSRALFLAALFALPLPAAAFAQTLTVTDITVDGPDGFRLTVPFIEAVDANLDEAGIRALFSADYTATLANLARLDAASLTIPSISMTYNGPSLADPAVTESTTITYSDLVLTDIADGVARGGVSLGEISVVGQATSVVIGRMSASLLDIGGIIDFYGLGGERPAGNEMRPIYKDFAFDGMTMTGPGYSCAMNAASVSDFSARPLKHSMTELMVRTQELENASPNAEPTPEQIAWLIGFYADLLTAFSSTPSTIDGMSCSGTDPTTGRTIDFSTAELVMGGFAPGIYPAIGLNGMRIEVAGEGFLQFGNVTWKQIDFNRPIEAVLAVGGAIDEKWFETNWRKLIPALDGFSLADTRFDFPDENARDGERIAGGIGALDVSLADYVNGIPSRISTTGSAIEIRVPDTPDAAPLRALGIETLSVGYGLKLHWDEAARTILVEDLQVSGEKLGTFGVTGTIANAGPELFSDNLEVAMAAATALTVTDLTIDVVNDGAAPLVIAAAALEQQAPPESFALQLAGMARALPLALLGATDEALGLSEALGQFLDGVPRLTLTLKSVDPNGLGLVDFLAAQENPETLRGKFTIAAVTGGEKVPFVFPDLVALTTPQLESPADSTPPMTPTEPPAPLSERHEEKAGAKN